MPIIPAFRKLGPQNCWEFKDSQGYRVSFRSAWVRSCLRKQNRTNPKQVNKHCIDVWGVLIFYAHTPFMFVHPVPSLFLTTPTLQTYFHVFCGEKYSICLSESGFHSEIFNLFHLYVWMLCLTACMPSAQRPEKEIRPPGTAVSLHEGVLLTAVLCLQSHVLYVLYSRRVR